MRTRALRGILAALYAASAAAVLYFSVNGGSYYLTPVIQRPRHPDYWELKPGGEVGHALGIAGSALMVLMLLYSVRKRIPLLRKWGEMRLWLQLHIFCGIVGPALVILHSSFKVQGLVALSFWSMIVVALSGFVGKYLYGQIPRRRSGDELTLAEATALHEEINTQLREEFQLPENLIDELNSLADPPRHFGRILPLFLLAQASHAVRAGFKFAMLKRQFPPAPRSVVRDLSKSLRKKLALQRRIGVWDEMQRLFHYWHVFHKPFAVIMYLFMALHIAVAVWTGYGGRPGE